MNAWTNSTPYFMLFIDPSWFGDNLIATVVIAVGGAIFGWLGRKGYRFYKKFIVPTADCQWHLDRCISRQEGAMIHLAAVEQDLAWVNAYLKSLGLDVPTRIQTQKTLPTENSSTKP